MCLALEGKSHRDSLADLLWTEEAALGLRGNLHQELHRLWDNLPPGALHLGGDWVSLGAAVKPTRRSFVPTWSPNAEGFSD